MPVNFSGKPKNILTLRLKELMAKKDRDRLMQALEKEIAKSGQIRILLELDEPRANDPGALIEDLNWLKIHSENINRVAIVGEQIWEETWIAIAGLFGRVEVKYFDRRQLKEVRRWLSE